MKKMWGVLLFCYSDTERERKMSVIYIYITIYIYILFCYYSVTILLLFCKSKRPPQTCRGHNADQVTPNPFI